MVVARDLSSLSSGWRYIENDMAMLESAGVVGIMHSAKL